MSIATAQGAFADARIGLVDDILTTAGWTRHDDGGWFPPERYRKAIELRHGRGHFARHVAIAFAVAADENTLRKDAAHTAGKGEP